MEWFSTTYKMVRKGMVYYCCNQITPEMAHAIWLVVEQPQKYEFVSWDDEIPNGKITNRENHSSAYAISTK